MYVRIVIDFDKFCFQNIQSQKNKHLSMYTSIEACGLMVCSAPQYVEKDFNKIGLPSTHPV